MEPVEAGARARAARSGRRDRRCPGSAAPRPRPPPRRPRRGSPRSSGARARAGRPRARSPRRGRRARSRARGRRSRARTPSSARAGRARRRRRTSAASRPRSTPRGRRGSPAGRAARRRRTRPRAARSLVPSMRRTTGRAIASRSASRPIALITERNISPARDEQRGRGRGLGDVRDHELRVGPGVRPDRELERALHRMAVDRDRPPVDEVPPLRQVRAQRHDQVSGSEGERCTGPVVSEWASLSVTEMIAKRGSTASS